MQKFFRLSLYIILSSSILSHKCHSKAIKPRPFGNEGRFLTWTYYPNTVYEFTGYYLNPTYIEFEDKEKITTISTPKPSAWQFVPNANRLFLKPIEDDSSTTATIMTNKRIYFFELKAEEPKGPFDPDIAFFVKFRYPKDSKDSKDGEDDISVIEYNASNALPDLSNTEQFNFNYTISGDEVISPVAVFDDGRQTYMKFKDVLPAIFAVFEDGYEGVVNFRSIGDYLIIEQINPVFTLRNGSATVCVFNENKMFDNKSNKNIKRR